MKRLIFLSVSILSITASCGYAQNLVPNYSFEVYDTCPYSAGQIYFAPPWTDPSNTSTDYFNSCNGAGVGVPYNFSGKQFAQDGNGYAGLVMYSNPFGSNLREYMQVQLTDSLLQDSCYNLVFHVSVADSYKYGVKNFGAYFSSTAVTACYTCLIPFSPQVNYQDLAGIGDTASWYKIEVVFQADGGEKYMTIGNFNSDTTTTIFNTNSPSGSDIAYYYVDSLSLTMVTCPLNIGIEEAEVSKPFTLFPNPSDGNMSIKYLLSQKDRAEIKIYNVTGKLIKAIPLNSAVYQSEINFDLDDGVYLYTIVVNDRLVQSDRLIIIK